MAPLEAKLNLPRAMLRMCRRNLFRRKLADSAGTTVTGLGLLTKVLVLCRLLERLVLAADEKRVGVLLPPSVAGVLVNAALVLLRRTPVNLNYTLSAEALNHCLRQAELRRVLTSRRVMERLPVKLECELVFLEDFRAQVSLWDKLRAGCEALFTPLSRLDRRFGLDQIAPSDVLTVIFTSGSTGVPKGVLLSFENVRSNVEAIEVVSRLKREDVFLGVLPFFHAFGFTCTVWAPLVLDVGAAYHFNPLEAQVVAKLCRKHLVTFMIGTPTLLRAYLKRCPAEYLMSLEVILSGAEKMSRGLADAMEKKFGVRPVEGYGATELSPLTAVNVPPHRAADRSALMQKEGTVGRPLPGVQARVVDLNSRQPLAAGQPGILEIRGPNVMLGYLNEPEKTAEVLRDGWYSTGDMAQIDSDGFITLTGRLSRFSKIGGEMVPHLAVEEALAQALGADEDEPLVAVTAVPDEAKGERLVVFHRPLTRSPAELCRELAQRGLPNLWIPSPFCFFQVDALPLLGTGKIDLQALARLAQQQFAGNRMA